MFHAIDCPRKALSSMGLRPEEVTCTCQGAYRPTHTLKANRLGDAPVLRNSATNKIRFATPGIEVMVIERQGPRHPDVLVELLGNPQTYWVAADSLDPIGGAQ